MKKYQLLGFREDENLGYLCSQTKILHRGHKPSFPLRRFVFWSKYEHSKKERILFNWFTGQIQRLRIHLQTDIYTCLEEVPQ